jgi:transcription termination factor Rho
MPKIASYSFSAKIYKVGINPCVKVPFRITKSMTPMKGYIPVKGIIEKHPFRQTLVPVKNSNHRLYVNGPMLKGGHVKVGDTVRFNIRQDFTPDERIYPMSKAFRKKLEEHKVMIEFKKLTPSRQKEVIRYLNNLRTEETLYRNIDKVIAQLKGKKIKMVALRIL